MIDKFLKNLSMHSCSSFLADSKIGLEKESLRVDKNGTISYKMHPEQFGSSLTNRYITTDYSEALIEAITPPCGSHNEALRYLDNIIGFVYKNLDNEYLWPASMPCIIAGDKSIPIAYYGHSNQGRMKTTYRRGLGNRYGRIMQVISGIHFNYSFSDKFWELYSEFKSSDKNIKNFKSQQYFIISRNLLRNGWIIAYLFGCSPAVCKSYLAGKKTTLDSFDEYTYYEKYATSFRMGDIGYQNNMEENMGVHINYNSLEEYSKSLDEAIKKPSSEYNKIGVKSEGYYKQLNSNILQIENEYYSTIRPKPNLKLTERPSKALLNKGVEYIELRSIDNNIFLNAGIDEDQMYFIELLIIHSLFINENKIYSEEYLEIKNNLINVAHNGKEKNFKLKINNEDILITDVMKKIFMELKEIANMMYVITKDEKYKKSITVQEKKVENQNLLPSNLVINSMINNKMSFYEFCMENIWKQNKYFSNIQADNNIEKILREETKLSLKKKDYLESNNVESFEDYINKYYKD
ncbi:MAG: glutamate--cysteine ligase [Gammaproteobacteria bacterium]|jgi:glutamate--cysteine ligase|nr:glutamate--cysteine ligase [Gammaproteobacteria bacterium]MBT7603591.1 glutamate--cysteine ligase [Gammaproteobacteria bacterium]